MEVLLIMGNLESITEDKKHTHLAIGLMSGTSVDCVDAALVKFTVEGDSIDDQLLEFISHPFPKNIREKIFQLFKDEAGSLSLACELNFAIGEVFAKAAERLILSSGYPKQGITVIGSHGQTFYHLPPGLKGRPKYTPSTLQMGEAAIIAQKTGIPVASDFRTADIAAGGQGAPLISTADYYLLSHGSKTRIIQNIGGIANCTYLPAGGKIDDVLAFDSGPGNMVIDGLVSEYSNGKDKMDRNGNRAKSGNVDEEWLKELLREPFFSQKPPKTTGREKFGLDYVKMMMKEGEEKKLCENDIIATATLLTAESIIMAYKNFCYKLGEPKEIILGGGGVKNKFLVNEIRKRLPKNIKLRTHEYLGINSQSKEAIGFALLGLLCATGKPGNVPSATGAKKAVPLGKIYYP
jgi:anhydro-N-acetylmuramic acid kinase